MFGKSIFYWTMILYLISLISFLIIYNKKLKKETKIRMIGTFILLNIMQGTVILIRIMPIVFTALNVYFCYKDLKEYKDINKKR